MKILMCKNTPVLDMETLEVFTPALLPGLLAKELSQSTLGDFMHVRRSPQSNEYARLMLNEVLNTCRDFIVQTRAFSLSDTYWICYDKSEKFEQLSPYYQYFWTGFGQYKGGAVPTVHTDGVVTKKWLDSEHLFKQGCLVEIEVARMCAKSDVPCVEIRAADKEKVEGIYVRNFTTPSRMFEPLSVSGKVDQYYPVFSAEETVEIFGDFGVTMLVVDAVIGNTDRHTGNAGFIRDTETGKYLGFAPLFDFNHAKDYIWTPDPTINRMLSIVTEKNINIVRSLASRLRLNTSDEVYQSRADYILQSL